MRIMHSLRTGYMVAAVCTLFLGKASGQLVEQSFELQRGWNAVYFEVHPWPSESDDLFAHLPIAAVWTRSEAPRTSPEWQGADTLADPACAATGGGWRVWLPPSDPHRMVSTLPLIGGGRVYLIEATAPTTMTISGKPEGSRHRWHRGYNPAGFHVVEDPQAAPTFAHYLNPSPALQNTTVYEINSNGTLSPINDLGSTRIRPGRGYWVKASSDTVYDGPLKIDNRSLRGINFAAGAGEHAITIENLAPWDSGVTISNMPSYGNADSASSRSGSGLPLVCLHYGDGSDVESFYQWRPLQSETWSLGPADQPGSTRVLRVAVNRAELGAERQEANSQNGRHWSVLEVTDSAGFRRWVGVEVEENNDLNGLWVGSVTVNEVAWVTRSPDGGGDPEEPIPTSSEFSFRIIIHEGDIIPPGDIKSWLLTEATTVWQDDHYVLWTPGCGEMPVPAEGVTLSPRVSTAAFSFDGDSPLRGDFGPDGHLKTNPPIMIQPNHPLNPFVHRYHPDHPDYGCEYVCNGGADDGSPCVPTNTNPCPDGTCDLVCEGGFVIERAITLMFDGVSGSPIANPELGTTLLIGTYEETLTGLYQDSIEVRGRFELRRVSDIPTLCGAEPATRRNDAASFVDIRR